MTPTLLVPLDGSSAAEAALPLAERLAAALQCDLQLLRVVDMEASDDAEAASPAAQEAASYLARVADQFHARGLPAEAEIRSGRPAAVIAAATSPQTMVVLTTYGSGGDPRHLGSVAERLSRSLTVPALFVPPSREANAMPAGPLIVGLDGSQTAEIAIEPAAALAEALATSLTAVRVAPWAGQLFGASLVPYPPNADAEMELGSNTYLAAIVERLAARLPAEYLTLRGHAADMLVEYATNVDGILVLASHGHSGRLRWGLGSTTDKVLRGAGVPVLVIPVPEGEGAPVAAEQGSAVRDQPLAGTPITAAGGAGSSS